MAWTLRTVAKTVLTIVLGSLLCAAAVTAYAYRLNRPPDSSGAPALFTVEKGESVASIARRLEEGGFIRSAILLRVVSRFRGTETRFQSGTFELRDDLSALETHDYLTSGNQVLIAVTVPEGWTARRMGSLLQSKGITTASEFEAAVSNTDLLSDLGVAAESAEGFLYPDTYHFPADFPADKIVGHLVDRFFEVLETVYPEYRSLSWDQLYDKVTMASIVEREYRSAAEAPKIASVFYNRLDQRMRLESCATVVYVMTEEENLPHPNRLFHRDLDRRSPFNTYRNFGLPPAPISNPGRVSLNAAFHPADTDYRFFVLRGPGAKEHYFSHTLSEHNEAALLYLKTP